MLVGTDYNYGGIKGIGPKKALKLVTEIKDKDTLFKTVEWDDSCATEWQEIFALFKEPAVNTKYKLEWSSVNDEAVTKLLVDKHDFNAERVAKTLGDLHATASQRSQKGLDTFFK